MNFTSTENVREKEKKSDYFEFVDSVTSSFSKEKDSFLKRVDELSNNVNVPRLLTAAIGLNDESGEFASLVKKIVFHGRELNKENILHMKKELGDIMWYLANACIALSINSFDEIINLNMEKLRARYGDSFSVEKSEKRREGDV
jgi:NTP pyrophosphatase (non-canonical NTP hydrolase)